jgi:hypothetical protein
MRSIVFVSLGLLVSGCADFGARSFTGQAPLALREKELSPGVYYIEAQGNGWSKFEMLTKFTKDRARLLCGGEPKSIELQPGRTVPDGKLPGIRIDSCYTHGFCPGDQAGFPLVYGNIICH